MPNWCANMVEIAGPEEEKNLLKEFVKNGTNEFSLFAIMPYEGDWDYDWCVSNWGTKWDVDGKLIEGDIDNPNLIYVFDSAWGPPDGAIKRLAELYPKLQISHLFAEPGIGFTGCDEYNSELGEIMPATNNGNTSDIIAGYIWSRGN